MRLAVKPDDQHPNPSWYLPIIDDLIAVFSAPSGIIVETGRKPRDLMDPIQVESANEAFYLAFEGKDYAAMNHLWSEADDVVCIHPGWAALVGRKAVMQSWRSILDNPRQGAVSFFGAQYRVLGPGLFVAICYEQAGNAVMIATNVFVLEGERLRLVLHQAGYCANPPSMPI